MAGRPMQELEGILFRALRLDFHEKHFSVISQTDISNMGMQNGLPPKAGGVPYECRKGGTGE